MTLYYSFLGAGAALAFVFYWASGSRRPHRDSTSIVLFQMGHASLLTVLGTHLFVRAFSRHIDEHHVSGWVVLLLPFAIGGFVLIFFTGATFAFTLAASAPIPTGVAYAIAFVSLLVLFAVLSSFIYAIR